MARTALSTTARGRESSARQLLLDGLEVEVLKERTGASGDESFPVTLGNDLAVAEDPVSEPRWRLQQIDEIHRPARGSLQASGKLAQLERRRPVSR